MDDQMAELARVGIPGIRVTAESTKEESRDLRQRLLDPDTSHLVCTPHALTLPWPGVLTKRSCV